MDNLYLVMGESLARLEIPVSGASRLPRLRCTVIPLKNFHNDVQQLLYYHAHLGFLDYLLALAHQPVLMIVTGQYL